MSFHRGGIGGFLDQLSAFFHEKAKREKFERKQAKKMAKDPLYAKRSSATDEAETERLRKAAYASNAPSDIPSWATPPKTAPVASAGLPASGPATASQAIDELNKSVAAFDATFHELAEAHGGKLPDFVPPPPAQPGKAAPGDAKPSAQVAFEAGRAAADAAVSASKTPPASTKPMPTAPTEPEPKDIDELRNAVQEFDSSLEEMATKDGKLPGEPGYNYNNEAAGAHLPGLPGGPTPLPFAPHQASAAASIKVEAGSSGMDFALPKRPTEQQRVDLPRNTVPDIATSEPGS